MEVKVMENWLRRKDSTETRFDKNIFKFGSSKKFDPFIKSRSNK